MKKVRKARNKKRSNGSKTLAAPKKPAGRVFGVEGGEMSNRTRRDLKDLKEIMAQHSRAVEQYLAKTGTAPRNSLIASASKYYPTLKKLAER